MLANIKTSHTSSIPVRKRHSKFHSFVKCDANARRDINGRLAILALVTYRDAGALTAIILPRNRNLRTESSVPVCRGWILAGPQARRAAIPATSAPDPQAENQIKRNPTTHRRCLNRCSKAKATEPVESQPVAAAKQSQTTYSPDLSPAAY